MRKGEELKAPRYASAAATRDYITIRDIIPNSKQTASFIISSTFPTLFPMGRADFNLL